MIDKSTKELLQRIAEAMERISPPEEKYAALTDADAYTWHPKTKRMEPVLNINRVNINLLKGIDQIRDILRENTLRFASGYPANNALLWGARGMGKSSLIKAVHATINEAQPNNLLLIEIHREDISTLPQLLAILKNSERKSILFCDDLSFETDDSTYKSLKAILEGGIEGRPPNTIFYATSNRRHLMARNMIENEQQNAIHPNESVDEAISLSDRFGLWLGFHPCDHKTFLEIIKGYVNHYSIDISEDLLKQQAMEWSVTRGARSGRVAWQFVQDLAGRNRKILKTD